MMRKAALHKNTLLLSAYIFSLLPKLFFENEYRLNLGLLVERSTRIDFFVMYYAIAIDFLIMAYCLHYPKGLDRRVTRFIFVITILDFVHLLLLGKQGFGIAKIFLAFLIVVAYDLFKKKYADN